MTKDKTSKAKEYQELLGLKAENQKKINEANETYTKSKLNEQEIKKLIDNANVDKARTVIDLLNSHVIDNENTVLNSEPKFELTIQGKNRDEAIEKLMEIIKRF